MKIVDPSYEILTPIRSIPELERLERIGRSCYKSEHKITEGSAGAFIKDRIIADHTESVLEHSMLSIRFICDRGVSHELVRHRLASYTMESTRYCNYANGITIIKPYYFKEGTIGYFTWLDSVRYAEHTYLYLIKEAGYTPQEARCVLPTCLKTELVMTTNYREWRHVLKLRASKNAHPQMRELMKPLLIDLHNKIPELFDDIYKEIIKDETK